MIFIRFRYLVLVLMIIMGGTVFAHSINLSPKHFVERTFKEISSVQHEEELYLVVNTNQIMFNPTGATKKIGVTSNVEWNVTTSGGGDWLTVTPTEGKNNDEVSVTAKENTGCATRIATITIKADGLDDQVVRITQNGYGYLNVSTNSLIYNPSGSTQKISVTSNVEWTVTVVGGDDWLTVSPMSGKNNGEVSVTVKARRDNTIHNATIIIKASGLADQEIYVWQSGGGHYVLLSTNSLRFNPISSTQKISITSNTDWSIIVNGGDDWLTVTPTEGHMNGEVSVTAKENEGIEKRTATITFRADGMMFDEIVNITQDGIGYLAVSTTDMKFNPFGSTQRFEVVSNVSWDINIDYHEGGNDWLSVSPMHKTVLGNDITEVEVSVTDNPEGLSRSADIIVSGGGLEQKIRVGNTGGKYISIEKSKMDFSHSSSCQSFIVSSNIDWEIDINYIDGEDWLSVSSNVLYQAGPYTSTEVEVKATENAGTASRTALINVTGSVITKTISISQEGIKDSQDNITSPLIEIPNTTIYSISGIKTKRLRKGFNIILLENGKAVKVVK